MCEDNVKSSRVALNKLQIHLGQALAMTNNGACRTKVAYFQTEFKIHLIRRMTFHHFKKMITDYSDLKIYTLRIVLIGLSMYRFLSIMDVSAQFVNFCFDILTLMDCTSFSQ